VARGASLNGSWRIVEMDLWDQEALDLLGPAFIEFGPGGRGSFRFIAIEAEMDCRDSMHDLCPGVDFSWEGDNEGDPISGRGWAVLSDGELVGRILGDESGFRAVRRRRGG